MKDFIDTTVAWVWEYALPSECVSLIEFQIAFFDDENTHHAVWGYLSPTGASFFEERLAERTNDFVLLTCRCECLRSVIERYAQILPEDHPMVDVIECIERRCIEVML